MFTIVMFAISALTLLSQEHTSIDDTTAPAVQTADDVVYKDVFKILDGVWQGKFRVYQDKRGQTNGLSQPRHIDPLYLDSLPLQLDLTVTVRQEYISETPYFQRVKIADRYTTPDNQTKVVESHGVNKVQNGKLWCVVKKPDETVIHHGELATPNTIIWSRKIKSPVKIEFFKETVSEESYTIIGWGYYGDDDPDLSPKYWFKANYSKLNMQPSIQDPE
jgi:hypothetical protein